MAQVSHSELRQRLAHYMDEAVTSRAPLLVTRQGGKGNVVILSEEEFEGWQETLHLMRSPANAKHLLRSIRDAEAGEVTEREIEPAKVK